MRDSKSLRSSWSLTGKRRAAARLSTQRRQSMIFPGSLRLAVEVLENRVLPSGTPVITTDKPDYLPGEIAQITGTEFEPNETVTLLVLHESGLDGGQAHDPWNVAAGSDGSFTAAWEVNSDDSLGESFVLYAHGNLESATSTSFTDAGGGGNSGNQAPELTNPGNQSVNELTNRAFTLHASDPDSRQTLTYSISGGFLAGMSLNPTTGDFSWTPAENQDGRWNVTFKVTDNGNPVRPPTSALTVR